MILYKHHNMTQGITLRSVYKFVLIYDAEVMIQYSIIAPF